MDDKNLKNIHNFILQIQNAMAPSLKVMHSLPDLKSINEFGKLAELENVNYGKVAEFAKSIQKSTEARLGLTREQLNGLQSFSNSQLLEKLLPLSSLKDLDVGRRVAGYFKAYDEVLDKCSDSPLFKYLLNNVDVALMPDALVRGEGAAAVSINASLDIDVIKANSTVEEEIVSVLELGGDFSTLSDKARSYLFACWPVLKKLVALLITCFTLVQMCEWFDGKMQKVKSPTELRLEMKKMTPEQKEWFEGQIVVIKDGLILRERPDRKAKELGRFKLGTRLELLESETGSWVHVSAEINGQIAEGWVYGPYTLPFD